MIKIVKNQETGEYVTTSRTQSDEENPKGYFRVEEKTVTRTADGWRSTVTKSMLFKGLVSELEQDIKDMNYQMTGKLYIEEILESDLDTRLDLKRRILSKELRNIPIAELEGDNLDKYEKAIQGNLKRTGKDGILLTNNGEPILRFTSYDPTSTKQDTLIDYDNFAEVAEWVKENPMNNSSAVTAEAELHINEPVKPVSARSTRATRTP